MLLILLCSTNVYFHAMLSSAHINSIICTCCKYSLIMLIWKIALTTVVFISCYSNMGSTSINKDIYIEVLNDEASVNKYFNLETLSFCTTNYIGYVQNSWFSSDLTTEPSANIQLFNYFKMHLHVRGPISKMKSLTNLQPSSTSPSFGFKKTRHFFLLISYPNSSAVTPLSRSTMKNETDSSRLLDKAIGDSFDYLRVCEVCAMRVQPNIHIMNLCYAFQKALFCIGYELNLVEFWTFNTRCLLRMRWILISTYQVLRAKFSN